MDSILSGKLALAATAGLVCAGAFAGGYALISYFVHPVKEEIFVVETPGTENMIDAPIFRDDVDLMASGVSPRPKVGGGESPGVILRTLEPDPDASGGGRGEAAEEMTESPREEPGNQTVTTKAVSDLPPAGLSSNSRSIVVTAGNGFSSNSPRPPSSAESSESAAMTGSGDSESASIRVKASVPVGEAEAVGDIGVSIISPSESSEGVLDTVVEVSPGGGEDSAFPEAEFSTSAPPPAPPARAATIYSGALGGSVSGLIGGMEIPATGSGRVEFRPLDNVVQSGPAISAETTNGRVTIRTESGEFSSGGLPGNTLPSPGGNVLLDPGAAGNISPLNLNINVGIDVP